MASVTTIKRVYRDAISLDEVYHNTSGLVRAVLSYASPVRYDDSFFNELFPSKTIKNAPSIISQLAYYGEIAVGTLKANLVTNDNTMGKPPGIHIESLCVLPAYRNKSIGTKLLNYIEEQSTKLHQRNIYVYIPIDDEDTQQWYSKRGFEKHKGVVTNHLMTKTGSTDCFLYIKKL
ncbi:HEL126Wp [Eremothecium sinecaudum]|uniref:HEL126Wp n=1 Tax=Eremothecium sinecaudum TaxID=45286 RepID=A0A0X8HTH1_9SACH|nr:HEL126Wp [Eremothecium sinecaudum]AMD21154.1 HEL126Wp [Eremothecium sinecaudum]